MENSGLARTSRFQSQTIKGRHMRIDNGAFIPEFAAKLHRAFAHDAETDDGQQAAYVVRPFYQILHEILWTYDKKHRQGQRINGDSDDGLAQITQPVLAMPNRISPP